MKPVSPVKHAVRKLQPNPGQPTGPTGN
jgi:ankyrin repeat protein